MQILLFVAFLITFALCVAASLSQTRSNSGSNGRTKKAALNKKRLEQKQKKNPQGRQKRKKTGKKLAHNAKCLTSQKAKVFPPLKKTRVPRGR